MNTHLKASYDGIVGLKNGIRDIFRQGPLWQKAGLLLLPFVLGLFVFLLRPLPAQIKERLDYTQRSIGVMFVDGSARYYDESYILTLPDGTTETWTRDRWKSQLTQQFQGHRLRGEKTYRSTEHKTHRWTGPKRLVQTVHIRGILMGREGRIKDRVSEVELTWQKKNPAGWVITGMHIKAFRDL